MAKYFITDKFTVEAGPQIGFLVSAKSDGEDVKDIKAGDRLYYDKVNASELRLDGNKYQIINLSDVRVVL